MIAILLLVLLAFVVLSQRGQTWTVERVPLEASHYLVLLALLTVWAYRSVWTAGYVYEDTAWLPFWNAPTDAGAAALAYLPWQVATWLSGGLPRGYHVFAVAVHLANGLLLYRLLRRFGGTVAVVAVGLFWLAPVNSEAVAYLSGAREAYVTFWTLLGITCADGPDWEGLRIGGLLVCAAVAVASKSSGIVALGLIPYGAYLVNPSLLRRVVVPSVALAIVVGIPGVLYVLHLQTSEGTVFVGLRGLVPFAALTSAAALRYLAEVVPYGLSLDHDWQAVASIWPTLALISLAVCSYLVFHARRDYPALAAGWLWTLAALAPRFVVQQSEVLNEHQIYLAFLPVWVGLGALLTRIDFPIKDIAYGW